MGVEYLIYLLPLFSSTYILKAINPFKSRLVTILKRVHFGKLSWHKEAYNYEKYAPDLSGATIKIADKPILNYYQVPYSPAFQLADAFISKAQSVSYSPGFEDFFTQKLELSKDQVNLVLSDINSRDTLQYQNLARLYDDLFRVEQFRTERPYHQRYLTDNIWLDLNKMELNLKDQIRRELKDGAKDTAFNQKDLRQSLLEFKVQNNKAQMMENLEDGGSLDDLMEPDGSNNCQGDENKQCETSKKYKTN